MNRRVIMDKLIVPFISEQWKKARRWCSESESVSEESLERRLVAAATRHEIDHASRWFRLEKSKGRLCYSSLYNMPTDSVAMQCTVLKRTQASDGVAWPVTPYIEYIPLPHILHLIYTMRSKKIKFHGIYYQLWIWIGILYLLKFSTIRVIGRLAYFLYTSWPLIKDIQGPSIEKESSEQLRAPDFHYVIYSSILESLNTSERHVSWTKLAAGTRDVKKCACPVQAFQH